MRIGDLRGVVEAGLCDTATSITVRRPTLSLSRDPDQHGGGGGGPYSRARTPRTLGRTFGVLFVESERVEGRVKEETRRGDVATHLPHCVVRGGSRFNRGDNPEDDR